MTPSCTPGTSSRPEHRLTAPHAAHPAAPARGTHPTFQPRGKAPSAPPHSASGTGPAAAPTHRVRPAPAAAPAPLTDPHRPHPTPAAACRPEDRARRCGASHLCEEPGTAGPGSGAGAGRPRRGWQRCSRRPSWPPSPPLPPAHCRFRSGPRGVLGTVVRGRTTRLGRRRRRSAPVRMGGAQRSGRHVRPLAAGPLCDAQGKHLEDHLVLNP